jgi:hypothetical protein
MPVTGVQTCALPIFKDIAEVINPFDTLSGFNIITSINTNGTYIVLINNKMSVATSIDGVELTVIYENSDNKELNDITFVGEKMFVVGNDGFVLVGDVGALDLRNTGFSDDVVAITSRGDVLFCLTSTNKVLSSITEFHYDSILETILLEQEAIVPIDIGIVDDAVVATGVDSGLNIKIITTI